MAVYAAEGEALRDWVLREGATRTIEIGLGYGISALHICEGLLGNANPEARHLALDPYQATRFADCGLQFLEEAGVAEIVEHYAEESQIALPRFLGEARSFHLASWTATTASTGSSSTSSSSGGSCARAG